MLGEVSSLEHEVGDYAVETGSLVTEAMFTGSEFTEVPGSLGNFFVEKFEGDTASRLVGDVDVKLK